MKQIAKWILAVLAIIPVNTLAQVPVNTAPPLPDSVRGVLYCPYPDGTPEAGGRTFVAYRPMPDGGITDFAILKPSGNAGLDAAARQCVDHWRSDRTLIAADGMRRIWIVWMATGWEGGPPGGYRFAPMGTRPIPLGTQDCASWYPQAELANKIGGKVLLNIHVGLDGAVANAAVIQSSGDSDLDQASIACVQTWHYRPATIEGLPMAGDIKALVDWRTN